MKRLMVFAAVLILVTTISFSGFAQDKSITVTGEWKISGSNKDTAKQKALTEAFRQAVENGLGVWVRSETDVKNSTVARDEILSRAEGYVTDHEIIKEGERDGNYFVTIRAIVSVEKIGADFKKLVGRVKTAMGNPSITFVLTTWEKVGAKGSSSQMVAQDISSKSRVQGKVEGSHDESLKSDNSYSVDAKQKASVDTSVSSKERANANIRVSGRVNEHYDSVDADVGASGKADYRGSVKAKSDQSYSGSVQAKSSESESYKVKGSIDSSTSIDASAKVKKDVAYEKIDEKLWKKYPDPTIIDSFQQEFKEKHFDLKAADRAREIAMTESLAATSINPFDRATVRIESEKEGANYVARGEVKVLDVSLSENTGNYEVRTQIGVEIIDVNSGDIVAAYSNTAKASNKSEEEAKCQSIKKLAVLAARTLADQTITTWQERSLSGRTYTIEIRNLTNIRRQKLPLMSAIESIGQITSQTQPQKGVLLLNVLYKGEKNKLGTSIVEQVGAKPGFDEKEFDGPGDDQGKITFEFK